jgi:hypothetical protein
MPKPLELRRVFFLAIVLLGMAIARSATAQEIVVPLFSTPPKVDGAFDPAQWTRAERIDGFISAGKLERRRAIAYVGATQTTLYVAIQSRLPDSGPLLATVDHDSLKVVYDDAIEIFVDPSPDDSARVIYHMLANSLGRVGYETAARGGGREAVNWIGNWPHSESQTGGFWNFQCAIPIASMPHAGAGRKATDGVWLINLCRDWRPDWAWSSLTGDYFWSELRFKFTDQPAPVVQEIFSGDPTYPPGGNAAIELQISNPSSGPLALKAGLDLVRNNMPEVNQQQSMSVNAGETKQVMIPIDANDPTTIDDLKATVTSADGSQTYFTRSLHWTRASEPVKWVTEKAVEAPLVDLQFAYYPTKNHMRVLADIGGLPPEAHPSQVLAIVRDRHTHAQIASTPFPMDGFKNGKQEIGFDLPPLNGFYEVAVQASGPGMKTVETAKPFERRVFPWETLADGSSTTVYPPFTPIKVQGNQLSTVLRTYILNDEGLIDQVATMNATTGQTRDLLAGPMRYRVSIDGHEIPCQSQPMQTTEAQDNEAKTQGTMHAGSLTANWHDTWDIDGTDRVELTLQPTGGQAVDGMTLEIPLRSDIATLLHANADRIRSPVAEAIPTGDGIVWDGSKVACDDYIHNFCPYVFLGNGNRGLCWFADNDKNWGWDRNTPNLDISRSGDQVILRIYLINQPTVITTPQTIVFGLLAAPIKPRLNEGDNPNWWRYRYNRDRYFLLGTDINWFGNNSCGSVYPVGRDMYLWKMLARGSKEKLPDDTVNAFAQYGLKYFTPFGPDAVKMWIAHVNLNLRSHLGQKMIFYYNRASCEEMQEFQTFQDEWTLNDFRPAEPAKPRDEIKVVPSDSYDKYCMFWYEKSFEIGNNKGVYWDNWFIAPSFNTEMTAAYRAPDGAIMPSAGIWAMREQAKRTFQMMNERKMTPIVFPHITSFSCLPMLSFATVQYEWEWKYSEGDVQDRFARDYIQLVTTGEQAGTWPVPLHDQLALADDPWTQRTFAAVRLVHELDGSGGFATADKLLKPIFAILDKPDTVAYRYWDDRPIPAKVTDADVPTLVYSRKGSEAIIVATSYATSDVTAHLSVDWQTLGLDPSTPCTDTETGAQVAVTNGQIIFPLKKHDIKIIHLGQ